MSQRERMSQLNKSETDVEALTVTVGKQQLRTERGHSGCIPPLPMTSLGPQYLIFTQRMLNAV